MAYYPTTSSLKNLNLKPKTLTMINQFRRTLDPIQVLQRKSIVLTIAAIKFSLSFSNHQSSTKIETEYKISQIFICFLERENSPPTTSNRYKALHLPSRIPLTHSQTWDLVTNWNWIHHSLAKTHKIERKHLIFFPSKFPLGFVNPETHKVKCSNCRCNTCTRALQYFWNTISCDLCRPAEKFSLTECDFGRSYESSSSALCSPEFEELNFRWLCLRSDRSRHSELRRQGWGHRLGRIGERQGWRWSHSRRFRTPTKMSPSSSLHRGNLLNMWRERRIGWGERVWS